MGDGVCRHVDGGNYSFLVYLRGGELYVCSRCVDAMGSAVVFLCEWHVCGAIFGKRWLAEGCLQKVLGIGCSVCNLDSGADVGGR